MRSLTAVLTAALVLLPAAPAWAAGSPPVAVDDAVSYRNTGGIDYPVDALANDSDPDGDTLTYTAVTPASKGNAYLQAGKLYYKPYLGNTGTDTFTYTVSDGQGNTATATVTATLWVDPPQVSALAITGSGVDSATLTWTAPARATSYRIYRNGYLVSLTSGLTFTDHSLVATGNYWYEVAALNGGGYEGPKSTPVYRRPTPAAPSDLAVTVTDDPTTLSLTWSSGGKLGPWNVYRDGALLASSTTPAFEDTGLVTGQEYGYQVQLESASSSTSASLPGALSAVVRGTPVVLTDIGQLFYDLGSAAGALGAVTVPERAIAGGRQQDHVHGIIVQQDGEDPLTVRGGFADAYAAAGGTAGTLGFPLVEHECGLREYGCGQFFEGGSIWYSISTQYNVVTQVIEDVWAASGWEDGPLGYPMRNESALPGGLWQPFQDGGVYWSAGTGAHSVSGEMYDTYALNSATAGPVGYPTTDTTCGLRDGGCWQGFQGGSIHWSPATGAQITSGSIADVWARQGWENGPLGYPTSSVRCGLRDGGCWQPFQGGFIHWSPATGAQATTGSIRDAWGRQGWENGPLGYPTGGVTCGLRNGGCYQPFQSGTIHWSPATGAQITSGSIRDAWARQGWENGPLGYPTGGVTCGLRNGGCYQPFQGGTIHWSPASGAQATTGSIRDAWGRQGWENGPLGYPTGGVTCGLRNGGCYQPFQGGSIHWSPATGAQITTGVLRDAWGRQGWENGRLGYPTASATVSGRVVRQTFQGGSISIDLSSGRVTYR